MRQQARGRSWAPCSAEPRHQASQGEALVTAGSRLPVHSDSAGPPRTAGWGWSLDWGRSGRAFRLAYCSGMESIPVVPPVLVLGLGALWFVWCRHPDPKTAMPSGRHWRRSAWREGRGGPGGWRACHRSPASDRPPSCSEGLRVALPPDSPPGPARTPREEQSKELNVGLPTKNQRWLAVVHTALEARGEMQASAFPGA